MPSAGYSGQSVRWGDAVVHRQLPGIFAQPPRFSIRQLVSVQVHQPIVWRAILFAEFQGAGWSAGVAHITWRIRIGAGSASLELLESVTVGSPWERVEILTELPAATVQITADGDIPGDLSLAQELRVGALVAPVLMLSEGD